MEIATKTNGPVGQVAAAFGIDSSIDASDMIIPNIYLTQKMSDAFDSGKAKEGEFIDSITEEVIGTEFDAQVCYVSKVWYVYEDHTKKKFVRKEPVTAQNRSYDYSDRDLVYKFTVLVGADVGKRAPYGITLSGTSAAVGRRLITFFQREGGTAGHIITFRGTKTQNDKGSWFKWDYAVGRVATDAEIGEARGWFESVSSGGVAHADDKPVTQVTAKANDAESLPF